MLEYFLKLYAPYKSYSLLLIFFSFVVGMSGFINSYLIKTMIDSLVDLKDDRLLINTVFWSATLSLLYNEFSNISWRAIDYIFLKINPIVKSIVISNSLEQIQAQSLYFFQNSLSGSLSNSVFVLAETVEKSTKIFLIYITRGIVQIFIALVSMYLVHPAFAYALVIWATIFSIGSLKFSRNILDLSSDYIKSCSAVSGGMVDSISNSINVKIFARETFESLLLRRSLSVMRKKWQAKEYFLLKFHSLQGLSITCFMAIVLYMLVNLRLQNKITIGDFSFIIGLCVYITEYIWTLTEYVDQLNDLFGKFKQSFDALYQPIKIKDKPGATALKISSATVIFDKITFQHSGAPQLFCNQSVVIGSRQKVGLVGCSGSGKSTFIHLLLRLYDVDSGKILIDNQDIKEVTQSSLHRAIGLIPQDPFLFHRSLLDNIRYGNPMATDEEVIQAAKQADIHQFITMLPEGYKTLVGERGVKISGGQKQRIALARAIIKNSPILILDEATSQIDSITESVIQRELEHFMQDKTAFVIAHRLSTLLKMDKILLFDQGKIVAEGTHTQLLGNALYHTLWSKQIMRADNGA